MDRPRKTPKLEPPSSDSSDKAIDENNPLTLPTDADSHELPMCLMKSRISSKPNLQTARRIIPGAVPKTTNAQQAAPQLISETLDPSRHLNPNIPKKGSKVKKSKYVQTPGFFSAGPAVSAPNISNRPKKQAKTEPTSPESQTDQKRQAKQNKKEPYKVESNIVFKNYSNDDSNEETPGFHYLSVPYNIRDDPSKGFVNDCVHDPELRKEYTDAFEKLRYPDTIKDFLETGNEKLCLLQFPSILPTHSDMKAHIKTEKGYPELNYRLGEPNSLRSFEEGQIGKLLRYSSGDVKFILNDHQFLTTMGGQPANPHEMVSIKKSRETGQHEVIDLGPIFAKLVLFPDIEPHIKKAMEK